MKTTINNVPTFFFLDKNKMILDIFISFGETTKKDILKRINK